MKAVPRLAAVSPPIRSGRIGMTCVPFAPAPAPAVVARPSAPIETVGTPFPGALPKLSPRSRAAPPPWTPLKVVPTVRVSGLFAWALSVTMLPPLANVRVPIVSVVGVAAVSFPKMTRLPPFGVSVPTAVAPPSRLFWFPPAAFRLSSVSVPVLKIWFVPKVALPAPEKVTPPARMTRLLLLLLIPVSVIVPVPNLLTVNGVRRASLKRRNWPEKIVEVLSKPVPKVRSVVLEFVTMPAPVSEPIIASLTRFSVVPEAKV